MRNRSKLLLAGLTVALAFGAFVSAAPARRIALSGRQWRAQYNKLRFIGMVPIECHVTLEGSFHSRTISKVLEALIGYVSRVTVDETRCTGGSARILPESLPWHERYNGFSGILPQITKIHIRIVGAGIILQTPTVRCQIVSSAASPLKDWINIVTATGVAESLRDDETGEIPDTSGSELLCGRSDRVEGTSGSFTEGPGTTQIIVRLVA
jgi:hypothetical protein